MPRPHGPAHPMPIVKHINRQRRARQNKAADERRGTARERGYTTAWDKFARGWLASNPLCTYCATQGRVTAAELVDHIEPHQGDPDRFWPAPNTDPHRFFASSCRACHDVDKQRAERAAERQGKPVLDILIKRGMMRAPTE